MSKLQAWRAVQAPWKAVKRAHGFIQKTLFEGEAPTLYRLKANKYAHCYGAPKRGANRSLQHLAPYLAGAVLAGMATFFVVLPLSFNRSYEASKQRYEAFARQNAQHAELLERQYDRGQFARHPVACPLATSDPFEHEYGSFQWDSTILSVDGDVDSAARELIRVVGQPEASLAEDDEPVESPDPERVQAAKRAGAQTKSVFGEFSGLARMLGDSCVDLGQGFPNYDPPDFVVQALRDELDGTGKGKVRTRHQYTRTTFRLSL
ncbi:unnamed protein product [Symbiodinium natans]|uniref:Uncharacterized protein n=1 Tax=Symbiodinium natans TaxID=878477 RepID=A0A812QGK2_9DINO|nr:unnamed protein product [Symbiodinium natans]